MSGNVVVLPKVSNRGGSAPFVKVNVVGTVILAINAALRKKFGLKTWAYLSFLTGIAERTAKHRLAGTRLYDFADLVHLLRSEIGFLILRAVMGDQANWPAWFKICVIAVKEAKLRTDMKQMQLLLDLSAAERASEAAKLAEDE